MSNDLLLTVEDLWVSYDRIAAVRGVSFNVALGEVVTLIGANGAGKSTILGAILFLRFGMAVGHIGFWGVILVILIGHTVTIPTALALSELATNQRVEGGGEYFVISRSFGLNIGTTIGISLFLSQAISVLFT